MNCGELADGLFEMILKMNDKETIHIMTSCDENLIKYVSILLESIASSLAERHVCFFLLYYHISEVNMRLLELQCQTYANISFCAIRVEEAYMEGFRTLARGGGEWCAEAYFSLMAHELLPADVDRVLYLDAADTMITGSIDEYYFGDFEEKFIIATAARYKTINGINYLIDDSDLDNQEGIKTITKGLFNSGSYVMNLAKMRKDGHYTIPAYLEVASLIRQIQGTNDTEAAYWGDQGFLSMVFLGNIKYFRYPEIKDYWYMPYNFLLLYYRYRSEEPSYTPRIIHFAGAPKPWTSSYADFLECFPMEEELGREKIKSGQRKYYLMWYENALKTERLLKKL